MSVLLATLMLSAAFCGGYLKLARRWQLLDLPGERSSHHLPTPHAGGAALITAFAAGLLLAALRFDVWPAEYVMLAVAALFLMLVGLVDDLRGLSVSLRMALYGGTCLAVAAVLLPPVAGGLSGTAALVAVTGLGMLWLLNLYNFMDGIDGIAALQCCLACSGAALLAWGGGAQESYVLFCLLLAVSHLGFLVWNWPPARLFMGDAGSIPTGFLLAALALLGAVRAELDIACWLVLLAVFITDTSWTLAWRLLTRQPFTRPHRLHGYQRLSRHWGAHLPVDLALLLVHFLWLLPLAWTVQIWPQFRIFLVILAYFPLLLAMVKIAKLT